MGLRSLASRTCGAVRAKFNKYVKPVACAALALVAVLAMEQSAMATPPTYVIDTGIDPADVVTGVVSNLTPFLQQAITVGFGFWAVRKGIRWIMGFVR